MVGEELHFPITEYEDRYEKCVRMMEEKEIDALLVYAEGWRPGHVQYLTGYYPNYMRRIAFCLLPRDCPPILSIGRRILEWARARTWVEDIRVPKDFVGRLHPTSIAHNIKDILKDANLTTAKMGFVGTDLMPAKTYSALRDALPGVQIEDVTEFLTHLRSVKSENEAKIIEKSQRIIEEAMESAIELVKEGTSEQEIALAAERTAYTAGADYIPWMGWTIVNSGPRAWIGEELCPSASRRKLKRGDMVVIDLGKWYHGYASDICRTCVVGNPSDAQLGIMEVDIEMENEAIRSLKPGTTCEDVYERTKKVATDAGYSEPDSYILVYAGHSIGLDGGEKPFLIRGASDQIEPGMIFATEPGLYVKRVGGSRFEDLTVVTKEGPKTMRKLPQRLW